MGAPLCILCCANFQAELTAAAALEGGDEVRVAAFPARCGRPPLGWDELPPLTAPDCSEVLVLGRACLKDLATAPAPLPSRRLLVQEQCFHLVACPSLVNEALGQGAYLVTPSWLADWRGHLAELGFSPDSGAELWRESCRELLLLDTGLDPQAPANMAEAAAALGVPARCVAVGLDQTRLLLGRWLAEWRLRNEQQRAQEQEWRHRRELADQVSAMDLLARLAKSRQEPEAIAAILDLCRMLFAPDQLYYLRVEGGIPQPEPGLPLALLDAMTGLDRDHAWLPSGRGFMVRIAQGDQTLGVVALDQLAFPEHRARYLNLTLGLLGVWALAIDNARTHKHLVEAEKMASLGVMVAGVAHEINTPLGVSLTAATSLREQAKRVSEDFQGRKLTQSDLLAFLNRSTTATQLLEQNLHRMAHLVENFRQVAVLGKAPEQHQFRLASCLAEVIRSLGERLPQERFAVDIQGDPEIRSYPEDWASIFTNLLTNSLRHGFKDRARGSIQIAMGLGPGGLWLDYRDDGAGMDASVLARLFDPFFTTDLQHGMGLGMHLVYNLVTQRLGGTIACASRPGQGVHFRLEIPQ